MTKLETEPTNSFVTRNKTQIHELNDRENNQYLDIWDKILLEKAIGETFELSDKPDLQSENIGVELTKVIFDGEANSIVRKLFGRGNSFAENCAMAEKLKGGKRLLDKKGLASVDGKTTVFYKNGLASTFTPIANSIEESVKDKLAKLNSGQYKIFKENYLLIKNMESWLDENEYEEILSDIIQENEIHFDKIFDKIFVSDDFGLYEYDYRKQKFVKYNIDEWKNIKSLAFEELSNDKT